MGLWKKFVGDKKFYRSVALVAAPIIIQNAITNFVNLLDNIMVGQIGTEEMSGVSIVNTLMMVYNISIFGCLAGTGIFTTQYFGSKDHDGVRNTMRFKLVSSLLLCLAAVGIFGFFGENLIGLYLNDGASQGDVGKTLEYGMKYLRWMFLGMLPFALTQTYAGTLRESGETMLPMKAGVTAVLVNLIGNYLLIFGKLGFPCLGVEGAAIATVLSRFVECAIVVSWTHAHKKQHTYVTGMYKLFAIPREMVWGIFKRGWPIMINGGIWAAGTAVVNQCYSTRGIEVVAGLNIANTLTSLLNVVYMSMGNVVGIMVGQLLGANKMKEARETDNKLIALAVASSVVMGALLVMFSPFFPRMYATTEAVCLIATRIMWVSAVFMPMQAILHTSYFTLRSGGMTLITFLFDSGFLWCITIPMVYLISRYTDLPIAGLCIVFQSSEMIKCGLGIALVKKDIWMKNIVDKNV